MVFNIPKEQRDDLVNRMDEHLAAIGFHLYGQTFSSTLAKSQEIEERAFSVAEVASITTAEGFSEGSFKASNRPVVELMRLYIKKAAELMKAEAVRLGEVAAESGGAGDQEVADADNFDLTSSDREFYTQKRAEQVLAPLMAKGAAYWTVKLCTKSYGIDAANVVTKAFANIASTLKEVDLSDIIAGRPEEEGLKAMQIITDATLGANITAVDVSDNAFGEKGVRACTKMLQQQKGIESIRFINNGISEQAARAILELIASPQSLKKFHLGKNMTGDDGTEHVAALLAKAPNMEDFMMYGSRFTADGAAALAKGLAAGTSLKKIDLNDNNVNEEGGFALAGMLYKQPNMRHVNFEATSLGPDAAGAVASALAAGCPQLEYLSLTACDITPEGVPAIAKALSAMKNLKVLHIAENELGDFGVAQICVALKMSGCPLQELDVSNNELVNAGAVAAARLAASRPGFASLNMNENYISDEGIEEVKSVLEAAGLSNVLGLLDLNDADMADEPEDELAAALEAMLNHMKL
tara:strand:- start:6295 stop:7869 length:1575 start_codon:yes stop_codon:yes gene_type:complete